MPIEDAKPEETPPAAVPKQLPKKKKKKKKKDKYANTPKWAKQGNKNLYAQDVEDLRQGYDRVWQEVYPLIRKFEDL